MKRIAIILFLLLSLTTASFILYSFHQTEQRNKQIKENIQKAERELKELSSIPPPHAIKRKESNIKDKSIPLPDPIEKEKEIRIELIGILKVQINENNSWETILKLLVLILVSYGGIKYIHRKFSV